MLRPALSRAPGLRGATPSRWSPAVLKATLLILALISSTAGCGDGSAGRSQGADGYGPLDLDAAAMEAKVTEMLETADVVDRHRLAVQLADSLDASNLPGAIAALDADLARIDPHEIRILAHAWAEIDPKGALDHMLESWKFPRINNQAVEEVVYTWAQSDSAAARAYVDPTFDGPIAPPRSPTKFMQVAVLKAIAVAEDWDQLTGFFAAIEDQGDREFWITRVMVEMNRVNGIESVKEWIDSIPWDAPHDLKVSAMRRGVNWYAHQSVDAAQDWYLEVEGAHPKAVEILPDTVQAQGLREPAKALAWLKERPEGPTRDRLIVEIVHGWLGRAQPDVVKEARAWAETAVEDPFFQERIVGLVVKHYTDSVEYTEALDWARRYPEAARADKVIPVVLAEWATFNRADADAYIAEHELGEEIQAAFEKQLERRRSGEQVTRTRIQSGGQGSTNKGGQDR